MKMGNVLNEEQARQRIPALPIGSVCGDSTDKLCSVSGVGEQNGAAANAVNCDSINQIGASVLTPGADAAGEEAKRPRINGGIAEPANFITDADRRAQWAKLYQLLREVKVECWNKQYR